MSHIVNDCPVNKFEAGLPALHTASDSARVAAPNQLHTLKKKKRLSQTCSSCELAVSMFEQLCSSPLVDSVVVIVVVMEAGGVIFDGI